MNGAADLFGPTVPRAVRRDRALPILIVASLAVHATIMLPSLLGQYDTAPAAPREIPIEVVQLPPKPTEMPKPAQKPKAAEKPKPAEKQKTAEKPKAEKKLEAKAAPQKPAPKPAAKPQQEARKQQQQPRPQRPPPQPQIPKPELASTSQRLRDLLGAMPAIALPGSSADGTEEVSYAQLVLSKLAKAKREGSHRGIPGAASVEFTLGDAGQVASVLIVRPSGDQDLDNEAIAMVNRGAPYPAPPPGARRDFTITLRFQPLI